MPKTTALLGLAVEDRVVPTENARMRSVIGEVDTSASGNVILRVGREHNRPVHGSDRPGGWEQTEYVVLTPDETHSLIEALYSALGDPR